MTQATNTQVWIALGMAAMSALGTVYLEFTHNNRDFEARLSALEGHRADDVDRLNRIETKLDQLIGWVLAGPSKPEKPVP